MKFVNKKIVNNPLIRTLVCATAISSLGDSLYSLAITLSVYSMTGSLFGVAGMWLIRAIIRIPCQFFSGVMVDFFNKKRICIYVYLLSAAALMSIVMTNNQYLLLAYVIIFILQGTSDLDNMAQMGIVAESVSEEDLTDVNNMLNVIDMVILLIGPGVAGLLYKQYGVLLLYFIDAITFIIASIIMTFLPYRNTSKEVHVRKFDLFSHARKGLLEVKKIPLIRYSIIISVFLGILGRFYEVDKIFVADTVLNIGAEGIIWFSYAMSVGGMLAPLYTTWLKNVNISDVIKYSLSCVAYIICFVVWGNADQVWISLGVVFLLGVFETGQSIMTNVIYMKSVDKKLMGMVMAYRKIVVVLSAIVGIVMAPILLDLFGVGIPFTIVGIIAVVISIAIIQKDNSSQVGNEAA